MSTATSYLEKTAGKMPFNAKGFNDFQKQLKSQTKKGIKAWSKNTEATQRGLNDTARSLNKTKKKMKKLSKNTTRKSLLYGGAAGTATGYASGNISSTKDDSL